MKLGSIRNVLEGSEPVAYPTFSNAKLDAVTGGGETLPTPTIQTGQNEIKVDVTLTYDVK